MYEYKVIPAPQRTVKVKGLKTTAERFAHLLEEAVNAEAGEGWEFVGAETLPCEERKGFTGTAKSFQSVLVFRRSTGHGGAAVHDTDDTHPVYGAPEHDEHAHADHEPRLSAQTAASTGQAPRLSLVATRHNHDTRAQRADPQAASSPAGRQEPVLRPGAAREATGAERPEPVLRTRARDKGESG